MRNISKVYSTRARSAKPSTSKDAELTIMHTEQLEAKPSEVNDNDDCSVTIDSLPDELLINIMKFLTLEEMLTAQHVCQRWERLTHEPYIWRNKNFVIWHGQYAAPLARGDRIGKYCSVDTTISSWSQADMFWRTQSPDYLNNILGRMPQLRICALPFERPAVEALFTHCHNITKLEILVCHELDTSSLENLVDHCPMIQILKLPVCFMINGCHSELIARLKFLQAISIHVDVSRWHSQPLILRPLSNSCSKLCRLNLWCFALSDVKYLLKASPPLTELAIRWTTEEKRCVFPDLLACQNTLEYLQLHEFNVKDEDTFQAFSALGELKKLKWLEMQCVKECPREAVSMAFRNGGLSQLQHIDLANSWALDDVGLTALINGCPLLRWLQLFGCYKLTDKAFGNIHQLRHLKRLNISRCGGLGSTAMVYIARLTTLRSLWLEYTDFRRLHPGIKHILEVTELRHLHMGTTTNLHLVPFEFFPDCLSNLKSLDLQCSRFDVGLMAKVKKRMPSLKIRITQFQYQEICDDTSDEEI